MLLQHCLLHSVWFTDGSDYTERTGPRDAHFVSFSDMFRRSCIMVQIENDTRYEFEEQFSLRFIEVEGSTLPLYSIHLSVTYNNFGQ